MASKGLAALTPNGLRGGFRAVGNFVARGAHRVDSKLVDTIKTAADRFPGYAVEAYSGYRPTSKSGTSRHTKGQAVDVRLIDLSTGQVVPNYQDPKAFRVYEQFAQTVRQVQMEKYPELSDDLRWGGYFSGVPGVYGAVDLMHFDLKPGGVMAGGSWAQGLTDKQRANWPGAESIGMGNGTPSVMDAPLTLAQTQMRDEAIRAAYTDPMRALDVVASRPPAMPTRPQTINPPSRLAPAPVGQVTRAALPSIPASLSPAPVGKVERAPLAPVAPSRMQTTVAGRPSAPTVGSMPAAPTRSLAHPVSSPKPSNLTPAPVGQVTKGPALAPAGPSTAKQAEAYGQYAESRVAADDAARLASQYSQYQRMPGVPPAPVVATPPSVPVGTLPAAPPAMVPAQAVPPAQVLAPVLAPPKTVRDYPIAAPAPPAATAYDVYAGLATEAKDNTGRNTVGMLPDGTTTVTNQWGVTTGMTPDGKQTAVGNLPSIPGISGPIGKTIGKAAIPAIGGLLGGPLGGILGAVVANQMAKPGGPLSGLRTVNTVDGPIQAHRVDRSLNSFPGRPSYGIRSPTFSKRSAEGMRGISPKAAADIEAGRGGLF